MSDLIDGYDAAFFDLDGVIYLGPLAVSGASEALAELERRHKTVMFVTNNAARAAQVVIDQLTGLGFSAGDHNVLTSAQVAVAGMARDLPPGAKVLVNGSQSLIELVAAAGLVPVETADDHPVAVVQGYDPAMTWPRLDEAALAIQSGATWYATNDDASRPTERGLVPGAGGLIAVIAGVVNARPVTFGKPHRPMLDEASRRTGSRRPIFVGDRIDTDIVGACNAGMDSLLVFTGAHGKYDLLSAGPGERPTHIGADVRALLEPIRDVQLTSTTAQCRGRLARLDDGTISLDEIPGDHAGQLDALWAIARLAWQHPTANASDALAGLGFVR